MGKFADADCFLKSTHVSDNDLGKVNSHHTSHSRVTSSVRNVLECQDRETKLSDCVPRGKSSAVLLNNGRYKRNLFFDTSKVEEVNTYTKSLVAILKHLSLKSECFQQFQ